MMSDEIMMPEDEPGFIPSSSVHSTSNSSSHTPRAVSPDNSHASSTGTSVVSNTSSRPERDRPWRKKDKDQGKKMGAWDVEKRLNESSGLDSTFSSSASGAERDPTMAGDSLDDLSDSEIEAKLHASARRRENGLMHSDDEEEPDAAAGSRTSSSSRHPRVISPMGEIDYDHASKSSRPSIGDRQVSSSAILGKVKSRSNPMASPQAMAPTASPTTASKTVSTPGSDRWQQFDTPDLPHQTARANANAMLAAAESAAMRDSSNHLQDGSPMKLDVEPTQQPTRASIPSLEPTTTQPVANSRRTSGNSRPSLLSKGATSLRNLASAVVGGPESDEEEGPGYISPSSSRHHSNRSSASGNGPPAGMSPHDAVRLQALQMLQLAGGPDSDDGSVEMPKEVRRTKAGGFSTTPAGGIRVRKEPEPPRVPPGAEIVGSAGAIVGRFDGVNGSPTSPHHEPAALAGLDMGLSYADAGGSPDAGDEHSHSSDPRFAIDEDDEADRVARGVASPPLSPGARDANGLSDYGIESMNEMHEIPFEEEENLATQMRSNSAPSQLEGGGKGSWSSRYSVDRHLMFLNAGKKSSDLLDEMDYAHRARDGSRSATGMYKASAYNNKSLGSAAMNASNQKDRAHKNRTPKKTLWRDVDLSDRSSLPPPPPSHPSKVGNYLITNEILYRRRKRLCIGTVVVVALACIIGALYGTKIWEPKEGGQEGGQEMTDFGPANHWDVGSKVTFMVTSDVPYNEADEEKLGRELSDLPDDAEFVVHLGDVGLASTSSCVESMYEDASSILKTSSKPVFVIPGNNDWNDCPNPDAAFFHWMNYFGEFEDNFSHDFEVSRQLGREENFAFTRHGVLFIGLNLVNGNVPDKTEWDLRHQGNVQWTEENLSELKSDEYRAVVILGHARPSVQMDDYFWPVVDDLNDANKPVLYLHASDGRGWETYQPFTDARLVRAVQLEKGGSAPPVKVTVDFGAEPFEFDRGI